MLNLSRHACRWRLALLCSAFPVVLLSACASVPPAYTTQVKDPWEKLNRATFAFNMKLDKAIARPVAKQYVRAVPKPARSGLHNVLQNLTEPVTIISDLLQGNVRASLKDTTRFLVNSTVGLVGWFDVARSLHLPDHDADFGEALAHWGVPAGPYLVLPILGPSDLRDAAALYPAYYANPVKNQMQARYRNAGSVVNGIDARAGILDLDSTLDSSFDPYAFMRDAWIQHRRFQLYNGNPPPQFPDYDLPPDDSSNAVPAAATSRLPVAATNTSLVPAAGSTDKNGG